MSQKRSIFEEVGAEKREAAAAPQGGMIDARPKGARAALRIWLFVLFALVVVMISLGGATRLSDAGLSITEWKPVTGALPPMSPEAWAAEFQKYQEIPQFKLQNPDMTLQQFEGIYWWEWSHRQLGRVIGLVWALGFAGFALALSADMIIASPRAKFAMAHLRLGLVPDLGALYLLPRVVGLQRAKELVFSTRDVSADEARELGIVMEVHASEALEARARDMAERMARAAPTAVALSKAMLNASLDSDRQSAFALEAASQAAAFAAPEPAAQVEAILGKQRPAFSGLKYARG